MRQDCHESCRSVLRSGLAAFGFLDLPRYQDPRVAISSCRQTTLSSCARYRAYGVALELY
jgi:hypothetical protein